MHCSPYSGGNAAFTSLRFYSMAKDLPVTDAGESPGRRRVPLALVGVGCRFSGGAGGPASFWRPPPDGVNAIGQGPADRWRADAFYDPDPRKLGKLCTRRGGFLSQIDRFDPLFFGISPREAQAMDPQHRL